MGDDYEILDPIKPEAKQNEDAPSTVISSIKQPAPDVATGLESKNKKKGGGIFGWKHKNDEKEQKQKDGGDGSEYVYGNF
ncbi:unnamed protein product [Cercopithifilaria johnstoni]|uniref:Uncharacterized protein n=1 Tax=Cercopithifilaria johnstoni TaxID=2874296 RepID=A0A8J2Q8K1_9BILA|nr:unnamed protein product [Cercopithifilaria johnstoni]